MLRRLLLGLIITFVICFVFISLTYTYSSNIPSENSSIYRTDLLTEKLTNSLLKQNDIQRVLYKSYINNQKIKYFSSYGLKFPYPNPYIMYWSLYLKNDLHNGNSELDKERYKTLLSSRNFLEESKDFWELNYKIRIYSNLNYANNDVEKYTSLLFMNYDRENNLFFFKSKDDDINMKLIATREVLETFKNIRSSIPNADEILNTCIKLYQQDSLFNENELGSSIGSGGVIISIFNLLGYDIDSVAKITTLKNRSNWLSLINSNLLNSLDEGNPSYFLYLKTIININEFLKHDFKVPKETLDKSVNKIYALNNTPLEPFFLSAMIDVYQKFGINTIPLNHEITNYIDDSIQSDFNKIGQIDGNIKDNFFGIALSEYYGFSYDKVNIKESLSNYSKVLIEDNITIKDDEKLNEIYYLLLSFKVLKMEIQRQEALSKSIANYITKYTKINDNIDEKELSKTLKRFYIGVRSLQILEQSIPKDIQEKVIQLALIIDRYPDSYTRIDICYMYDLILATDRKRQKSVNRILEKMVSSINELKSQNGIRSNKMSEYPNIYSTYMGYSIVEKSGNFDDVKKEEIKKFLEVALSGDSIMGLRGNYQSLELGDLYYATLLSSMYKE